MKCPKCGRLNGHALYSKTKENGHTQRRRVCRNCGERWTTIEIPVAEVKKWAIGAAEFVREVKKI